MISFFKKLFKKKQLTNVEKSLAQCGCACHCPNCKDVLNINPNTKCTDTDLVRYVCSQCGEKSEWNFDIAPIPILINKGGVR